MTKLVLPTAYVHVSVEDMMTTDRTWCVEWHTMLHYLTQPSGSGVHTKFFLSSQFWPVTLLDLFTLLREYKILQYATDKVS